MKFSTDSLAKYFRRKGVQNSNSGNFDQAISNFKKAIFFDPKNSLYYVDIALVQSNMNQNTEALKTLEKALELNPEYTLAIYNRGYVKFYLNDINGAVNDFEQAFYHWPDDKYVILWLSIAEDLKNKNGIRRLRQISANKNLNEWPGPIISLYLGNSTEEDVFKIAADSQEKLCETYFFLGHYHLRNQNSEKAKQCFQNSVNTNVKSFREYWASLNELKGSSSPGEFHPQALTDPDVTVSRHPALIIQLPFYSNLALPPGSSHHWLTKK